MSQQLEQTAAQEAQEFIDNFVAKIGPLEKAASLAWWSLNTTGEKQYEQDMVDSNVAYANAFLDKDDYEQVEKFYQQRDQFEPVLARQLDILRRMFLASQLPPEYIQRIAELEAELESAYNNHRGVVDGQEISDNQIVEALKKDTDLDRRRKVWEASKQIGATVEQRLRELVRLRNEAAALQGFRDFYARSLYLQEINEAELYGILDKLEQQTREPFKQAKAALDAQLAARFGVAPADLRPWHYADPFFQEAPPVQESDLDELFTGADIEALTKATYNGMGLEVADIMQRSDLYERPGKTQHAFCLSIDHDPNDVRVLANFRPTSRWMGTSLHEFGHGIYDKYLDANLPWLVRTVAHISTTEAIAMLMGRLALDASWIEKILGKSGAGVAEQEKAAQQEQRLSMLIFVRWALVVVHFEKNLYQDPAGVDLNKLWWDLVERFQMVPRPENRNAPDWAAKIHIATTPVYYHNYILGELTASQLQHYLQQEGGIVLNKNAGAYLRDRLFMLGARYPWNETLAHVTGETLNPQYFVDQFVEG